MVPVITGHYHYISIIIIVNKKKLDNSFKPLFCRYQLRMHIVWHSTLHTITKHMQQQSPGLQDTPAHTGMQSTRRSAIPAHHGDHRRRGRYRKSRQRHRRSRGCERVRAGTSTATGEDSRPRGEDKPTYDLGQDETPEGDRCDLGAWVLQNIYPQPFP